MAVGTGAPASILSRSRTVADAGRHFTLTGSLDPLRGGIVKPATRLVLGLLLLVAVGLLANQCQPEAPSAPPPQGSATHQMPDVSALPVETVSAVQDGASTALKSMQTATGRLGNPVELTLDLRAVYEHYKDSRDSVERHTAYRAWSACFPTFIAPQGQPVSLDILTRSLAPNEPATAMRIDAYRNLQARCRNFSDLPRETILQATQQLREELAGGAVASPGDMALRYLNDGNPEQALKTARAILASGDPFSISSLREFVEQHIVAQVDAQTLGSDERPDLRSLAFTVAACQIGLECGPASLTALQLCAGTGACSGGVADRYLGALPSQADRDALQIEVRRVLDALRTGKFETLGL